MKVQSVFLIGFSCMQSFNTDYPHHTTSFFFFSDRGSEPSSPNETENPLDAAVKARRKDKDEEKETGGT